MPLRQGDVFAGYTVLRELSADGTGARYLATHPRTHRQDALRVLPASAAADHRFRARFQRRADVAATLRHPHILGVHGHGEYRGLLWLATEFVDGTDAEELLRVRYPSGMPTELVTDIVTAIADALDHAHGRQSTHGDVTAANILLGEVAGRRILLAGFDIPPHGNGVGADRADPRGDQCSLAATAEHLLTGGPTPTYGHPSAVPAIARAMDEDPRRRFDTCAAFAAALRDTATAVTQARPVIDPTADPTPTTYLDNTQTAAAPYVPIPAWSAEEIPAGPPTPPPAEPDVDEPSGPTAKTWAVTAVAVVVVLTVLLAIVVTRGRSDQASPGAAPQLSTSAQPTSGPVASVPSAAAPASTGVGGRPKPPTITGADPTGENCEGGYQVDGQSGWASQGVRGSPAATCFFVGSVLKSYWNAADPSAEPRTVVAAGAIPCSEGAACVGDDFLVTCSAEGTDAWITCRGGRGAVVVLY